MNEYLQARPSERRRAAPVFVYWNSSWNSLGPCLSAWPLLFALSEVGGWVVDLLLQRFPVLAKLHLDAVR
jgi:hypothetical protein